MLAPSPPPPPDGAHGSVTSNSVRIPPPPPPDDARFRGSSDTVSVRSEVSTIPSVQGSGSVIGRSNATSGPLAHLSPEKRREWLARAHAKRSETQIKAMTTPDVDVTDPLVWLELVNQWIADISSCDSLPGCISAANRIRSGVGLWHDTLATAGVDAKLLAKLKGPLALSGSKTHGSDWASVLALVASFCHDLGIAKGEVLKSLELHAPGGKIASLAFERDAALTAKASSEALIQTLITDKEALTQQRYETLGELKALQAQHATVLEERDRALDALISNSNGSVGGNGGMKRSMRPPQSPGTPTTDPVIHSRGRTGVSRVPSFGGPPKITAASLASQKTQNGGESATTPQSDNVAPASSRNSYYRPWLINAKPLSSSGSMRSMTASVVSSESRPRQNRSSSLDAQSRIHVPAPAKPSRVPSVASMTSSVRSRSLGPRVLTYKVGKITSDDPLPSPREASPSAAHRLDQLYRQTVFSGHDLS